ncbi:amino acid adenylation domain-containing protein [Streptomyces sp. CC224B]|uniref:amino acid adenylation domain-containing protein n=1 Tax=Streptomyces sp. CC224B TaxID=3044571 RepID=UPI0024A958CF|nr:amino acid adenylation domain-containing protein [Streptomyces sp. CC224B]
MASPFFNSPRAVRELLFSGEKQVTDIFSARQDSTATSAGAADTTLWDLLRARAARRPHATAVSDPTARLDYGQLVGEAGRWARHLRERGIGQGDPVACAAPRGTWALVAQLAVFAAGAVYVPVDADDPPDRLTDLIGGVGARWLLGLSGQRLPRGVGRIDLDDPAVRKAVAACPHDPAAPGPPPEAVAYIIHTSGTSGRPKPVAVGHRAIAHTMRAYARVFPDPVRCMAAVSPVTTDAFLPGVWWTLLSGGHVLLTSPDPQRALRELAAHLSRGPASHTVLTPSLYSALLPRLDQASPRLRQVVVAGEPCPSTLVTEHHHKMPGVQFVNAYGPTEAAVWCTAAVLRPGDPVTVGTALPGTPVLVVDADGRPVPDGETGEVCVTGVGLANGYHGDAELTAARFVPDPQRPHQRMYRTGDLGRLDEHGRLELLGRRDAQVKVRGFRVEPDGVARVLRQVQGVRDVAVSAHQGRLVAHVVPHWDERGAAEEADENWRRVFGALDFSDERTGWTSSYTGEPLPAPEMDEWIAATVRLATEQGPPDTVLDLGCGTGMILTRLARTASRAVGVDTSAESLTALRERLEERGLSHVELRRADVADTGDCTGMDLVLCNSVTPYLHGPDHLARTVRAALAATAPAGRAVFGDVKDRTLQDAFHASVVLRAAADDTRLADLRAQWRRRVALDPSLLVDPRWFTRCGAAHADVRPRTGRARNEMNDFRYDAVLFPRRPGTAVEVDRWRPWPGSMDALHDLLAAEAGPIGLVHVPNRRTAGACAVRAALAADGPAPATARDLRHLAARAEADAVHPGELQEAASRWGRPLRLSRAAGYRDGAFDAVFLPARSPDTHTDDTTGTGAHAPVAIRWPRPPHPGEPPHSPVHRHVLARAADELLPALRQQADARLPEPERPSHYTFLTALPTKSNGKLDRSALPAPSPERPHLTTPYRAPHLPTEQTIATILATVLQLDRVGLDDDFMELGGDSLTAVRAATQIGDALGLRLPFHSILHHPTPARLAAHLTSATATVPAPRAAQEDLIDPGPTGTRLAASPTHQFLRVNDDRAGGLLPSHAPRFALACHYRIRGPLDTRALARAVDHLVRHQPALRTAVHLTGDPGHLHQTVGPARPGVLHQHRVDPAAPGSLEERLAALDATTPLDPAGGRVFAATLLSAGPQDHLLGLRLHHLTSDGCSLNLVERQLSTLYDDALAGRAPALPATDYRALNAPERPRPEDVAFWADRLTGARPTHLVPPAVRDAETAHDTLLRTRRVPATTATAFRALARAERLTLAGALYALFAATVAADTGQDETLLLAISAPRPEGTAHTAGLHAQALPVRHRFSPSPGLTARQALRAAGHDLHEALRHDSASLLTLAQAHPHIADLFAASQFVFYDFLPAVQGLRLSGCVVERTDQLDPGFTGQLFQLPVDLGLLARENGDALDLAVLFDPAYAPAAYAESLLRRMDDALTAVAASADRPWRGLVPADPCAALTG